MNIKELLQRIPAGWDEITLQQFQELSDTNITNNIDELDGIENSIAIISKFTNTPIEELEELPMKDLITLGNKLSFMVTPPEPSKQTRLQFKRLDEVTYNDYITYLQAGNEPLKNLQVFIKNFSNTKLSEDEILQLPITEVMNGFFLYRIQSRKYLSRLILSTRIQITKQRLKESWQKIKQLRKKYK